MTRHAIASGVTLPSSVRVVEDGPLPRLDVSTGHATASVYFHGAHLARWQPSHAAHPVLWMSERSQFAAGKPIRGGIPICFPWFGPHAGDPSLPAHGVARITEWRLTGISDANDTISLTFSQDGAGVSHWPQGVRVNYRISIGRELELAFDVANGSAAPVAVEEALHTYFAVGSIDAVSVTGLERAAYLDKVAGAVRRPPDGHPIRFASETDRVYLETTATCFIVDESWGRRITVGKSGSRDTVVWNPWIAKARNMPDFGDDEYPGMVCVESANVGNARVAIASGDNHVLSVRIAVDG